MHFSGKKGIIVRPVTNFSQALPPATFAMLACVNSASLLFAENPVKRKLFSVKGVNELFTARFVTRDISKSVFRLSAKTAPYAKSSKRVLFAIGISRQTGRMPTTELQMVESTFVLKTNVESAGWLSTCRHTNVLSEPSMLKIPNL